MTDPGREIQELRAALLKANGEIEKLSRIKSDFISVISHELRTPLTSIKESVSLVLDGIGGPLTDGQRKILTISKNNIDRLAKLIIDILDLSKMESGRVVMRKRKLSINELIKNVFSSMKALAEQKDVELSISLGEFTELTWFDPDRIGQVLKNLISNAIKFNRDGGKIKISSSKENINNRDIIKVTVEDNGIGISMEDIENLFKNFSPLDTSMTRKYGGAGLGLAISKGIIELHGGNIWVVSEPESGSKFIFTIPIYGKYEEFDFLIEEALENSKLNDGKVALIIFEAKDAKDKTEDVIVEAENVMKKTVRGPEDKIVRYNKKEERVAIIACTDMTGALAIIRRLKGNIKIPLFFGISVYPNEAIDKESLLKKAEEELKSGKKSTVSQKILLIIDDEEALTSMLSFRLKSMGFDTITASNGERGLELAKKNKPDLILLDLMMPNMDGFEVSKRLKKDLDTKQIPIVIFSALADKNTKESLEQLGAAGFIEKPFEPEDLFMKIEKALEAKNE